MNETHPDQQLDALLARARAHRPDTSAVEYAFETRLMARLRADRATDCIWTKVSWRMIPFFATCALALALWHMQITSETDEAAQIAYTENPDTVEAWDTLN